MKVLSSELFKDRDGLRNELKETMSADFIDQSWFNKPVRFRTSLHLFVYVEMPDDK